MPELPEVETIRRSLLSLIKDKTIQKTEIFTDSVFCNHTDFTVTGFKVVDIRRRGKYLLFDLAKEKEKALLMIHLRMTGKLLYSDFADDVRKHTHVRLHFVPEIVDFNDIRRFGKVELLPYQSDLQHKSLLKLGPEPFSKEFSLSYFLKVCSKRPKTTIKQLLLDQTVVAGLGNIYCDEVLFRIGIHPASLVGKIPKEKLTALKESIAPLLTEAIGFRGTSFRDYVDGLGKKGEFQLHLKVYSRAKEKCYLCGSEIEKCKVAGRGTHFCPNCQTLYK